MSWLLAALLGAGPPAPALPDRRQAIAVGWDVATKACVPAVHGIETGDIATDAGKTALIAALPDKGADLRLSEDQGVPYACTIAVVDTLKHAGFYGRIGLSSESPPPMAAR